MVGDASPLTRGRRNRSTGQQADWSVGTDAEQQAIIDALRAAGCVAATAGAAQ